MCKCNCFDMADLKKPFNTLESLSELNELLQQYIIACKVATGEEKTTERALLDLCEFGVYVMQQRIKEHKALDAQWRAIFR